MLRSEFFKKLQESPDGREYLKIIENAKNSEISEKGEIHHIYPRSFEEGKIDTEDNLVQLSVRDHLLCHYYLAKCFPVPETCHAFRMMWDLHRSLVDQEHLFEQLDKVVELRKRGRIKTVKTLEKQRQQALGRIHIHRDGHERKIYPKDLPEFEKEGWTRGRAIKVNNPSLGKMWISKGKEEIQICRENLEEFQKEGWDIGRKGSFTKGKIRMSRGSEIKYATEETLQDLIARGFQKGIKIPRRRMEKDGQWKYVKQEDIEKLEKQGWTQNHTFQRLIK